MKIAVDVMGGDAAPAMVLAGLALAKERHGSLEPVLYGDETRFASLLAQYTILEGVRVVHCQHVITADMKASQALRASKGTSMRAGLEALHSGEVDAFISAGNTGALMALARSIIGIVPGVDRPAITSFFPTQTNRETIMLDLGATLKASAATLHHYGVMGHYFAKSVFGWDSPTLGLLNVGIEQQKGHEELKQAAELLKADTSLNFQGFVEGNDIAAGTVDVVITDGFTGNIALKTAEGVGRMLNSYIKSAFQHSPLAKIGYFFAKGALERLKDQLDPRQYNGAVFLGLEKVVVKSHGGTDAVGFAAAIDVAVDMLKSQCIPQMRTHFLQHQAA